MSVSVKCSLQPGTYLNIWNISERLLPHFSEITIPKKYMFTFLKLLSFIKCRHNLFLKSLKQCKIHVFTIILFFSFMCDDLSFINTTQQTLKSSKKCFNSQDGWEKTSCPGISADGYQQKHEVQVASKKVYRKTKECSKHLRHIAIEKDIFSEFKGCFFSIFKYL